MSDSVVCKNCGKPITKIDSNWMHVRMGQPDGWSYVFLCNPYVMPSPERMEDTMAEPIEYSADEEQAIARMRKLEADERAHYALEADIAFQAKQDRLRDYND